MTAASPAIGQAYRTPSMPNAECRFHRRTVRHRCGALQLGTKRLCHSYRTHTGGESTPSSQAAPVLPVQFRQRHKNRIRHPTAAVLPMRTHSDLLRYIREPLNKSPTADDGSFPPIRRFEKREICRSRWRQRSHTDAGMPFAGTYSIPSFFKPCLDEKISRRPQSLI